VAAPLDSLLRLPQPDCSRLAGGSEMDALSLQQNIPVPITRKTTPNAVREAGGQSGTIMLDTGFITNRAYESSLQPQILDAARPTASAPAVMTRQGGLWFKQPDGIHDQRHTYLSSSSLPFVRCSLAAQQLGFGRETSNHGEEISTVQLVLDPRTCPRIGRRSLRTLVSHTGRFHTPRKRPGPQKPTTVPGAGNPGVHEKDTVTPGLTASVRKEPS
jgi:hypothetical protein